MGLDRLNAALSDRYTLERELGQGGMATVYLAHDIKHERDVAVKVLHPDLGAALGGERFLSEIRTTAKLQHPHILPLLDSGSADGLLYYVMPYVTGETLRARLERERQLPINDAVLIAREVADALGSAHALGIIHRDIKPENILLQGGHALVADFGIALAVQTAGGQRMTQTGLSLGTPQYMSPEQAMGERAIDARSDIYALGAVTYEMLAGDPPFTGSSVQAIVAKVLTEKPSPIRTVRDTVPSYIEGAVLTALAKLPADRFASAAAFAEALQARGYAASTGGASVSSRAVAPSHRGLRSPVPWAVALMLALAAAAAGWLRPHAVTDSTPLRFILTPPEKLAFIGGNGGISLGQLALSPDGAYMAYSANGPQGIGLYVQRIGELGAHLVPGGELGGSPAFSPDGRWIAFEGRDHVIRKVAVDGTTASTICPVPLGTRGITWLSQSEIVFAQGNLGQAYGLWRVSADGGGPVQFAHEAGTTGRLIKLGPRASDDGRFVFYLAANGNLGDLELAVITLSDATPHHFKGADATSVLGLIDGTLYFAKRDGSIMGAPFDASKLTLGTPVQLGDSVAIWNNYASAALSRNGTLLYTRGGIAKQLIRVDEGGTAQPLLDLVSDFLHPRLSPDGRRVAFEVAGPGTTDIWIADLGAHTVERLTRDGRNDRPEWTPDGRRIIFPGLVADRPKLLWQSADGSSPATALLDSAGLVREAVLSPDGKLLAYRIDTDSTGRDIYVLPMAPGSKSVPLLVGPSNDLMPRFSPDSKWLTYVSDESGTDEVYVRPALGGGRVAISSGGGTEPLWTRDGRRLIYRSGEFIIATTLAFTPAPSVVRRDTLFRSPGISDAFHPNYDVFPDGKSFVFVRASETNRRQILILNWLSEVRLRTGAAK